MELVWDLPSTAEKKNVCEHTIKTLLGYKHDISSSVVCYMTSTYKTNNVIIGHHVDNGSLEFKSYERTPNMLQETTYVPTWLKNIALIPIMDHANNNHSYYFSAFPTLYFVYENKKLFTRDNHVMIVNIHFIVTSLFLGDVQIQLTGIRNCGGKKQIVQSIFSCGPELVTLYFK